MNDISVYSEQLLADVQSEADAKGIIVSEAFFEKVGDFLLEAGELSEVERAYFTGKQGYQYLQIDGYGGDPRNDEGVLTVIVCDFEIDYEVRALTSANATSLSNRARNFVSSCKFTDFLDYIEETSLAYVVGDMINTTWSSISKVKVIFVTNGDYRGRMDSGRLESIGDKEVELSIWDLKRLKAFEEQGQSRAELVIDFGSDYGGALPILPIPVQNEEYPSYLAVIPGDKLAEIYAKWGARLLESNVRSFLQARNKINRGIRDTIKTTPEMFLSYNNGLSVTAESVKVNKTESGYELAQAENLQIVNGGQTTASLHAALKDSSEELKRVHVQMKLTIVPKEASEEIVPKISEFANSQNKVNAADFFANHPFHTRIEQYSRKILAPRGLDGYMDTKWFYERARGQYADQRSKLTIAQRKAFDNQHPKSQFFTKTDLAKYENLWAEKPHIVSLGAQKNFIEFAKEIGKQWKSYESSYNDYWYKQMIAKAIIFKATEKLVSNAEWYAGGYRANIVAYAISKLVYDTRKTGGCIDLDLVWRRQTLTPELRLALLATAEQAQKIITNPLPGIKNYSEWAKKEVCWQHVRDSTVTYTAKIGESLISTEEDRDNKKSAQLEKQFDDSIDMELHVYKISTDCWEAAYEWSLECDTITLGEQNSLRACKSMHKRPPSPKQCKAALLALDKLKMDGFEHSGLALSDG
ncbi:AIPR family protein [Cobetia sp. 3AK]|uniref:AIPR family protein n=1 Tax=Cobetia sp. 3AK TaxID=3040020 RepID=UPI002447C594|nr:AIPR family protein [Cobetia sp. 3AK]MDH2374174.1 AIPR family protein [Cobetia sp. 3AK]